MALTDAQIVTLGNAIRANTDPIIVQAVEDGAIGVIQSWYNDPANGTMWGIRSSVDVDEVVGNIDWSADYDDIDLKAFTAMQVVFRNGSYATAPEKARDALVAIFPPAASSTRAALLGVIVRQATPAEGLFLVVATGPGGGNGSSQSQGANFDLEGDVTLQEVARALAS